jgi:hypothetical protein
MECGYCKKILSSYSNLKNHQQNTKYCLKLQGRFDIQKDTTCICYICEKLFTTKNTCDKHVVLCRATPVGQLICNLRGRLADNEKLRSDSDFVIEKLRNDNYSQVGMIALMQDKIDRQEAKIISTDQLVIDMNVLQNEVTIYKSQAIQKQDCIEQMAKQPKMTSTTNVLNMHALDLSDDRVKSIIEEYYNIDYLLAGSKGVAQFTIDKVLTKPDDKIIYSLTDRSREAYNFKNVHGVIEKDTKGRKLREVVYKNGIKEKAFSIANTMVLEDPDKADELRCIEYALEVADLDPSTIRTKEVNDKVEHAYCKELRETAC